MVERAVIGVHRVGDVPVPGTALILAPVPADLTDRHPHGDGQPHGGAVRKKRTGPSRRRITSHRSDIAGRKTAAGPSATLAASGAIMGGVESQQLNARVPGEIAEAARAAAADAGVNLGEYLARLIDKDTRSRRAVFDSVFDRFVADAAASGEFDDDLGRAA